MTTAAAQPASTTPALATNGMHVTNQSIAAIVVRMRISFLVKPWRRAQTKPYMVNNMTYGICCPAELQTMTSAL
ncbi:conserved hypothetical protein [Burkholderia vietnamiensis]|nr:conserved hypothetical protein [Burkholderia vietnamiensis]